MYSSRLSRSELGALLMEGKRSQRSFPFFRESQPEFAPAAEEIWACWPDQKDRYDELPRLIIVADDALEDFFAWAITFLPAFRPLTSFLRVLPWTMFTHLRNRRDPQAFANRSVLVGLILGETLTNATGRGFVDSLPLTAFEATYSYAVGRAIALGFDQAVMPYLSRSWQSIRDLEDQRSRRLPPELLDSVWAVVLLLSGHTGLRSSVFPSGRTTELLRACEEILHNGQISLPTLERLSSGRIRQSQFEHTMRLPREQRVIAFESAMRELTSGGRDEPESSFLVGYLASLVGDGSLEHAHLVFPLQPQFPTAMLWYAVCASLSPTTRVLTDYGNLGVRIVRLLERKDELLNPPSCDIALPELRIMLRGHSKSRTFRQTNASSVRVELAPCITTLIRSTGGPMLSDQQALIGDEGRQTNVDNDQLRELVYALRNSLSLAESILSKSKPGDPGDSQARSRRRR